MSTSCQLCGRPARGQQLYWLDRLWSCRTCCELLKQAIAEEPIQLSGPARRAQPLGGPFPVAMPATAAVDLKLEH
jgi:hypothetical protein